MTNDQLKKLIKKLPPDSGIYIFRNSTLRPGSGQAKPLYIGKALNLKNRVSSYLKTEDPRLKRMILEAKKVDFIKTNSDIEALILESQYIKRYRPDFNIMLRDDKQYLYVSFSEEKFSKIFLTHQPIKRGQDPFRKTLSTRKRVLTPFYVGPFTEGSALKITLRLLRKIFPYCTCKQTHHNYCLNYHIEKCIGDCCLKKPVASSMYQVVREYKRNINAIKKILSGKNSSLMRDLEKDMKESSKKHEFEKAMELQKKIEKIKRVFQNAQIIHNTNYIIHTTKNDRNNMDILKQLAKLIGINRLPHRIEAYDIANIQGKHAVGAMVVFVSGLPNKNEYRKFKLSTSEVNNLGDTGMLKEVLTRRFNHLEWPYPDLILIDGGKAQLNATKSIITNCNLPITVIALTKNEKHIGHKIITKNGKEILLSKLPGEIKNLLLQINSEAHRFAISYYQQLHAQSIK